MKRIFTLPCIFLALPIIVNSLVAAPNISLIRDVDDLGFLKPIPVSISGFTGEVDSVLKNDLLFMGIQNTSVDQAKYLISGNNAGRVEGHLVEKISKVSL